MGRPAGVPKVAKKRRKASNYYHDTPITCFGRVSGFFVFGEILRFFENSLSTQGGPSGHYCKGGGANGPYVVDFTEYKWGVPWGNDYCKGANPNISELTASGTL